MKIIKYNYSYTLSKPLHIWIHQIRTQAAARPRIAFDTYSAHMQACCILYIVYCMYPDPILCRFGILKTRDSYLNKCKWAECRIHNVFRSTCWHKNVDLISLAFNTGVERNRFCKKLPSRIVKLHITHNINFLLTFTSKYPML